METNGDLSINATKTTTVLQTSYSPEVAVESEVDFLLSKIFSLSAELENNTDLLEGWLSLLQAVERVEALQGIVGTNQIKLQALGKIVSLSWDRFQQTLKLEDLDATIDLLRKGLDWEPDGDSNKCGWLMMLGEAHTSRFAQLREIDDITKMVECWEQVVLLTPNDFHEKPELLVTLSSSYETRFRCSDSVEDLAKSVEWLKQAVMLTPGGPDALEITWLVKLGCLYGELFSRSTKLEDIEKSIEYLQDALKITSNNHEAKSAMLSGLGCAYELRFEHLGALQDIQKAVYYQERVASLTPDDHPSKSAHVSRLGNSYRLLYTYTGQNEDLHKSISCCQQALKLSPQDDLLKPELLSNLGASYDTLFQKSAKLEDIDEAISCFQKALLMQVPGKHRLESRLLNNIGSSFASRFKRLNSPDDLDQSIKHLERAAEFEHNTPIQRAECLSNLGNTYRVMFQRFKKLEDIHKAINYLQQALELTPVNHPNRPVQLNILCISYQLRFGFQGQLKDVDEAIRCQEQAIALIGDGHRDKPVYLNNLGTTYNVSFERLASQDDLDRSIKYMEQALMLTPDGHSERLERLSNLGNLYWTKVHCSKRREDALKGIELYRQAALMTTGHPSIRLRASWCSAQLAFIIAEPSLEQYTHTLTLLPQVVWMGYSLHQRYENLSTDVRCLITEAAAEAIRLQQYNQALEWLEQGRSVVWSQILQLRTPLEPLVAANHKLGSQLMLAASELEKASLLQPALTVHGVPVVSSEATAQHHRRLAERWDELLNKARSLPGFHNLLKPTPFVNLVPAARSSTVVVINVHENQCDAIALLAGACTTVHIRLPSFSETKAVSTRNQLLLSLQYAKLRTRTTTRQPIFGLKDNGMAFNTVLSTLWADIVRPVLEGLGYLHPHPYGANLPHVTWCTTGLLSFLPLHAAGYYNEPKSRVFDYVVSSYTPTLTALLKPGLASKTFQGILAVGQAEVVGSPSLPGTKVEMDRISANAGTILLTRLEGRSATVDAVLEAMNTHSWVHLACHAFQDTENATASGFLLNGGSLSLAAVTQKRLQRADFAFLSACQTATGDEKLPNEALHLAAGMLMAGYSSIIATMWSIQDQDAPLVAEQVYAYILAGGMPNSERAAKALHNAVASLRSTIGEQEFMRWVPYIHMGCC